MPNKKLAMSIWFISNDNTFKKEMENHENDIFLNILGSQIIHKELDMIRYKTPCSVYGCSTNSMSNCHLCMKSYCSEHLHLDLHNLKNISIINQLRVN